MDTENSTQTQDLTPKEISDSVPEDTQKKPFKITKQHLQGAIAMLLVCAFLFSAVAVSIAGGWQFGTLFVGYEDASEQPISINPGSIEAVSGWAGGSFLLTGLPEAEIASLLPGHIFLGGYFGNLTVTGLEVQGASLLVHIGAGAAANDPAAVDWQGYAGGDGIIALTPEAFSSNEFYYQGYVDVIYPELVSETEAILRGDDGSVSQSVVLSLRNDNFARAIAAADLIITGSVQNAQAEDFIQEGNRISFTLTGTEQEFGTAYFAISGDKMTKGLDVDTFIRIGRVPMPIQNSSLFTGVNQQTLDIFMDFDTFADNISLSMLSFDGVMSQFDVTHLELLDSRNIRLSLTGTVSNAEAGSVRFDSAALLSGQPGRVCEVNVEDSRTQEPAVQSAGTGDDEFEFMQFEPIVMARTLRSAMVSAGLKLVGKAAAKGIAKAVGGAAASGIMDELGLTQSESAMLQEIIGKLDEISGAISTNQRELNSRFDKIEFEMSAEFVGMRSDELYNFYTLYYKPAVTGLTGSNLDAWYERNMKHPVRTANGDAFIDNLNHLITRLDPDYGVNGRESIIRKFEAHAKSKLPFEHNVYVAMKHYIESWDSQIAQYMTVIGDMLDYNKSLVDAGLLDPTIYATLELYIKHPSTGVVARYEMVAEKLENYINNSSYFAAHQKMVVKVCNQTTCCDEKECQPNQMLYLVSTGSNKKYLLADNAGAEYQCYVHFGKTCIITHRDMSHVVHNGERSGLGFIHTDYLRGSNDTTNEFGLKPKVWLSDGQVFSVHKRDSKNPVPLGGKPKEFQDDLVAFNSIVGNPNITWNTFFKQYLFTVDFDGNRTDHWYMIDEITPSLLYWGYNDKNSVARDKSRLLGFFSLDSRIGSEIRSVAAWSIQNNKGGWTGNEIIAILMCEG